MAVTDQILTRLMQLHPKIIDLGLGRVEALLARMGHPESRLPPVVHVAGTNGKGSVVANLRAIAEAAGLKVHVYTSPHLVRFHERIRLAGQLISEERLQALLSDCARINREEPITFFEITTCAAFQAFAEDPADLLLLETGLGGRLDATNIVAKPAASVLTSISMDHMQYLGDSLLQIAGEKAAIQKAGCASIIGPQEPAVMAHLTAYGTQVGAILFRHQYEWDYQRQATGWQLHRQPSANANSPLYPAPGLAGDHQYENAAIAVATALQLREQGFALDDTAIAQGLRQVEWPARLQRLQKGPLCQALPQHQIILDGGHNAAAGQQLAQYLAQGQQQDGLPIYLICGMLNTKSAADFLAPLAPHCTKAYSLAIPGEVNSFTAAELAAIAATVGLSCKPLHNRNDQGDGATLLDHGAWQQALDGLAPGRVVIAGSLYLAGQILRDHA